VNTGGFRGVPVSICLSKSAAAAANIKQYLKTTQFKPSISNFGIQTMNLRSFLLTVNMSR
jgi:hypothetical protein